MKVFVSYARNDLKGGELEDFLKDLEIDLEVRLGEKASVLFRDLRDLELGAKWKPELEEALRTSSICLAICSESFFKSPACGREFAIFRDRLAEADRLDPAAGYRAIFPIIWIPTLGSIPAAEIKHFQFDHAGLPADYSSGLRSMFRLSRLRDDARSFTSVLSASIAQALQKPLPPANARPSFDQIPVPSGFSGSTTAARPGIGSDQAKKTSRVRVVMAVGRKTELAAVRTIVSSYDDEGKLWRPFMPDSELTIVAEAQGVASRADMESVVLPLDHELCDKIGEAEKNNEIIVVLADPWTLRLPRYADQIRPFDTRLSVNCTFIVVWNRNDDETNQRYDELEETLDSIFLNKKMSPPPGHMFSGVGSCTEFADQLKGALTEANLRVIQAASRHRRADDARLKEQANDAGINVATAPVLQNIGERQ
jgi:FxsC-like protein